MIAAMRILVVGLCLVLAGCAAFSPYQEQPQVNITSFTTAPHSGAAVPRFLIGVQVINPNRASLLLRGMSYSVEIEGTRVLSGVANNLPEVPAYGSADFIIEASPDLLGAARVVSGLISGKQDGIRYNFDARLDVGSFMPDIRIRQSGTLR